MSPKASTRLLATQSDERLAAMARAGHDRAFEALVQRYRRPLLRYCRRICTSEHRAEDVVQQTLLQAWSALRRGAAVRELRPWLYRIAHNTAVNLARDSARDGNGLALDLDDVSGAEPAVLVEPDLAGGLHLRETLTDMAALPHMQREVIFRTALAGHSHEEVATALGITDGAVRGLLYRARATLRAAVTAVTPPPLIAWISGPGQGIAAERAGELAAGGGLGAGILLKGGLAVLAAGTLITGAAIVHEPSRAHRVHLHASHPGAARETAALAAPSGAVAHPRALTAHPGGSASASPHPAPGRFAGRAVVRLRIGAPGPRAGARRPAVSPQHPSAPAGSAPTSTTVQVPAPSPTPPSSSGSSPSGGSGSGGSGGTGTGSGGSTGGGSGGGSGSGTEPVSSPPPPSGGSGTGPVTTVVNEAGGLLEHTVHGVLGHSARFHTPASTSALRMPRTGDPGLDGPPHPPASATQRHQSDRASDSRNTRPPQDPPRGSPSNKSS